MTTTPDQAREWRDNARPGPWYVHTDPDDADGTFIYDDPGHMCIAVEQAGSDYRKADLDLIAAAPELAQTIAGMTWQYGVERTYLPGNETAVLWFPSEGDALQEIDNPNLRHCNPRLVRRLVGPVEVTE